MAQEPLANQQQQQPQQLQHSWSNSYNTIAKTIAHSNSIPADPQAPTLKKNHDHSNIVTMNDVFLLRDVPVDASVGEMDEVNRELEEFRRF